MTEILRGLKARKDGQLDNRIDQEEGELQGYSVADFEAMRDIPGLMTDVMKNYTDMTVESNYKAEMPKLSHLMVEPMYAPDCEVDTDGMDTDEDDVRSYLSDEALVDDDIFD